MENRLEKLEQQISTLTAVNKQLTMDLRKTTRSFDALKRQHEITELTNESRNVLLKGQIVENARQRRFLTSFMLSTQNYVIFLDDELSIAFISKAFLGHIGVEYEDDVVGMNIYEFYKHFFDADRVSSLSLGIEEVANTMQTYAIDTTMPDRDGNTHYYKAVCSPMSDEANRLCGLIIIYYDETDIVNALREAVEANKAKSSFLATMSHEIRTPMNAIIGVSEIALGHNDFSAEALEAFEKIHSSGHSLLGIINDILDLSKIESGKLEILPDRYDTASLINDAAQLNVTRIGSKPIRFVLTVSPDIPAALIGDELRIKQILNNILSNAIKYTEKGEVRFYISCDEIPLGSTNVVLIFQVSDTGQGMSKEQLDKLFNAYSRFNASKNRFTEGTGLGMNITKRLVSLMNGTIEVESEEGVGSTFTVRLPQGRKVHTVLGKKVAENLSKFEFKSLQRSSGSKLTYTPMPYGRVLIVDDIESNLYVASGLMKPYGLSIETVTSGQRAIDKVSAGTEYDIIFMDHMMPIMDGIEATKIIRDLGYSLPIVALTANAVAGTADMFLSSGFDGFISKPIDIRQLNDSLNRYVRDRHATESVKYKDGEDVNTAPEDFHPFVDGVQYKDGDDASTSPDAIRFSADQVRYKAPAYITENNIPAATDLDPMLVRFFVKDADKAIEAMEASLLSNDLQLYRINVHAMKSALANIQQKDLSERARVLEEAAKANDLTTITEKTAGFLDALREVSAKLRCPEAEMDADVQDDGVEAVLDPEVKERIRAAASEYDITAISAELDMVKGALHDKIEDLLLASDFEAIEELFGNGL
jgi:signal transduction histidine kinase/CheY-like chemotaxis protein/HPt (histidine-containing phosphotransfer) domain-containing protein